MVHALQKGELSPSDVSGKVKDVAGRMDDKDAEDYASTKHKGKPEKVAKETLRKIRETIRQIVKENPSLIEKFKLKKEVAKRDYKAEYKKFQSSTKMKKYRAELNKYNRQKGTYGNGDGKDASHKGGKIVGFEAQSKNRGRAEKSRLKKEELGKRCTVKEVSKWLKTLEEFRYRKVRGVDARRVASFVNNGMNEEELPISLQKKWEHKKYGREKHLANKYVETVLNVTLKESVNETVIKENLMSFYKYMGDFYGKKGLYPDTKGRDLKVGDINKALSVYLKKYAGDKFTGDSLDRERVRDILIKMRKLDPDYSKKESVKETIEPTGNIKKVLDVAKNKQAKKIGGTLVDLTTASMMTQVWDKVNDSSKEKMNKMNTKQLIRLILKLWDRMGTPRV